jgi:uncharacterized protein
MDALKEFSIPIKGLKNGVREFDFTIGEAFFKNFEGSPVSEGEFDVHLTFDKKDSFIELTFDFDGTMRTDCDRCTASIDLPFGDSHFLLVKYSIEDQEEDAEIVYISPEESHLNVAQYIYEFISISIPFHKTYDCQNDDPRPCDMDILKRLDPSVSDIVPEVPKQVEEPEDKKNPFNDLKKLFNNN